jgi:hypothetical protein
VQQWLPRPVNQVHGAHCDDGARSSMASMAAKTQPASAEESAFVVELNKHLSPYGAAAGGFTSFDDRTLRESYGLVFSRGSKRHTLTSDMPFSYDPPREVIVAGGLCQWRSMVRTLFV